MGVFFSIIIPVYNGEQYIKNCLDSIYRQGLGDDDFEVICVNDCSIDNTAQVISEYGKFYQNIRLINHETNRRQGSARNTGVKVAKGKYILYLDQDDVFESGALKKVFSEIQSTEGVDILMCDELLGEDGKRRTYFYLNNSREEMTGRSFLKKNEIPWTPWLFVYRRDFLIINHLSFTEKVRFEDTDYVINSVRLALRIKYVPILLYNHTVSRYQTSRIESDKNKITDLFKMCNRIKCLAIEEAWIDSETAKIIAGHHLFMYRANILLYWWRLSYKDRKELLVTYKPMLPCKDKLVSFIGRYPRLFLMASTVVKPLLPGLRYVYLKIKDRKSSLL